MITIKNIIFDLGSVILKGKSVSVLEKLNIDDKTHNILKKFFIDCQNLDLGKESLEEKYIKCNFPKEYDKYKDSLIHYYQHRDINMELINCIHRLKENDYNIYVLSDNNKESFNYYKNNSNFKDVDGWVASYEYSTIKKDGLLFDILMNKFNLDAQECYFIDDKIENINEAERHGIKGYIFDEKDDINNLYQDMKKNGIKI